MAAGKGRITHFYGGGCWWITPAPVDSHTPTRIWTALIRLMGLFLKKITA